MKLNPPGSLMKITTSDRYNRSYNCTVNFFVIIVFYVLCDCSASDNKLQFEKVQCRKMSLSSSGMRVVRGRDVRVTRDVVHVHVNYMRVKVGTGC